MVKLAVDFLPKFCLFFVCNSVRIGQKLVMRFLWKGPSLQNFLIIGPESKLCLGQYGRKTTKAVVKELRKD